MNTFILGKNEVMSTEHLGTLGAKSEIISRGEHDILSSCEGISCGQMGKFLGKNYMK